MGQLFDLLQGQVERWDGVRNKTLNNEKQREKMEMENMQNVLHIMFMPRRVFPVTYLRWGACGRGCERGIGRGAGWGRTD